jgi:hypothetical protein
MDAGARDGSPTLIHSGDTLSGNRGQWTVRRRGEVR